MSLTYGCVVAVCMTWIDKLMKIEEAIVYVLVKQNGGMTTDQIADAINRQRLHGRTVFRTASGKKMLETMYGIKE